MKFSWRTEWPLWVLIAAMFFVAAITWPGAPDRIPVHWGMSGEVDRYGGKFEGLLLMPLIALAIYLLLLFIPRLDPGWANYAHFAGAYTLFRFGVIMVLALIYAVIHLWIRGYPVPVGTMVPVFIGLLFLLIGSIMGKIRPNWFVGIRTPWTLSSKLSWTKTHRLAGYVFMGIGVGLIASGLLRVPAAFVVTMAVGGAGIVWTIVYSYLTWRHDPARIPPAGTLPAD
jgi:uncharacterized membrane protein